VLINVTSFFREPQTFETLKKKIFPRLLKDRPADSPIRVWVPGCSTGEEAYSIAICLLEYLGNTAAKSLVQIFATDISDQAVEKARQGIYPAGIAGNVAPARLQRFFVRQESGYQVSKAVRDLCVFARQDVTKDAPFSKLDLISCRNLLIYLGPELQKRAIDHLPLALKPTGVHTVGELETIGGFADLFRWPTRNTNLRAEIDVAPDGLELSVAPNPDKREPDRPSERGAGGSTSRGKPIGSCWPNTLRRGFSE
jgi:two-component system CheB/CheR fusion protein